MSERQLPTDVESPQGKLVYLSLDGQGSATVEELHEQLGVPRITLYSVLRTLRSRGLVERDVEDGDGYVTARPA